MSFEKEIPGVRRVDVLYGDTLQQVALRELGNASQWVEIALLNGLRPPYIVDDPALVVAGVIKSGGVLLVPSSSKDIDADTDQNAVFGIDLDLTGGSLSSDQGDFVVISGVKNLDQAIAIRVKSAKRELMFHPEYGCWIESLIGTKNGPVANNLAAFYIKSALLEDERIQSVPSCIATVTGDVISIDATVNPVSGVPIDVSITV